MRPTASKVSAVRLIASAARIGMQTGRSKVVLGSQDDGSGRLTGWYRRMGFAQVGVNTRGYPQLEAPIARVLAGVAQARLATAPAPIRPRRESRRTARWNGTPTAPS